jgi:cytochrome P450
MLPAFHREQVEASTEAMVVETEAALAALPTDGVIDVYAWMRRLAMRIAMRALLGLDPDDGGKGALAAEKFEEALGFFGIDFALRLLRGPGSPWRRLLAARAVLDEIVYEEIARRRAAPDSGRRDILSLLVGARGEAGEAFSDSEIRDQLITLMFAGHDTSTSTVTFALWELAHHPGALERLAAEQDEILRGAAPTIDQLEHEMPYLDTVVDEVLRLYPPAWIGPRRVVRDFEWGGYAIPRGAYVNYCSWASHRLPDVFPEPEAFVPERFTRERKAALPRGAYVPFGGGKRICIGKRFGLIEVKLVLTMLSRQLRADALPGRTMTVRQSPTLGPRGGLKMRLSKRA